MDKIADISLLLQQVATIQKHVDEVSRLKGEHFNVFSILKLESAENKTHSAFLGELLNPKGSHLQGAKLLRLFLEQIGYEGDLDVNTAQLTLEKSIGGVSIANKEGGRIDIYLEDANGNSIAIENKIYAGDQEAQIARYVNYNQVKNTVYYLTLFGEDASTNSKRKKEAGTDYFLLSYVDDITAWLELTIKEAAEQPILRESIRQYVILIKKLTNQLSSNQMEDELKGLIEKNYQAAIAVVSSLEKVEFDATASMLTEVIKRITNQLGNSWTVELEALRKSYTGINIRHTSWPQDISIKLEGQSKVWKQVSVYGIIAHQDKIDREKLNTAIKDLYIYQEGIKENRWWPLYKHILFFNDAKEREKLFDTANREILINDLVDKMVKLALACEQPFINLKSQIKPN